MTTNKRSFKVKEISNEEGLIIKRLIGEDFGTFLDVELEGEYDE